MVGQESGGRVTAKSEADVKRAIVQELKDHDYYGRRVEDQWAVGLLDLIISTPFTGVMLVEAKLIRDNIFRATPRQWVEMQRIQNAGGKAFLVGWKTGYYIAGCVETGDVRKLMCFSNFIDALRHYVEYSNE